MTTHTQTPARTDSTLRAPATGATGTGWGSPSGDADRRRQLSVAPTTYLARGSFPGSRSTPSSARPCMGSLTSCAADIAQRAAATRAVDSRRGRESGNRGRGGT